MPYRAIEQEVSQTIGGSSLVLLASWLAAGDAASSGYSLKGALRIGLARRARAGTNQTAQ